VKPPTKPPVLMAQRPKQNPVDVTPPDMPKPTDNDTQSDSSSKPEAKPERTVKIPEPPAHQADTSHEGTDKPQDAAPARAVAAPRARSGEKTADPDSPGKAGSQAAEVTAKAIPDEPPLPKPASTTNEGPDMQPSAADQEPKREAALPNA